MRSPSKRENIRGLQELLQQARADGSGQLKLPTLLDRKSPPKHDRWSGSQRKANRSHNNAALAARRTAVFPAAASPNAAAANAAAAAVSRLSAPSTSASAQQQQPTSLDDLASLMSRPPPRLPPSPRSQLSLSPLDRQRLTSVDDLASVMADQRALVQPPDPHLANMVILGTPNAGKSTLVNHLVGQKISAVSHKRNTTRSSVLGVASRENKQLVIFDTPGVLPKLLSNKYQKDLTVAAWDSAQGADVAVVIVDSVRKLGPAEYELFEKAKQLKEQNQGMVMMLVVNKMDLCKPPSKATKLAQLIRQFAPFTDDQTYFTSFEGNKKGVEQLVQAMYSHARPAEWEYPLTTRTDQSPLELVNELIREKIFHRVHQEIPYRVKITNTGWTEIGEEGKAVRIDVLLEVETQQQKVILTGKNGSMLRYITQRALPEVQALVGKTVWLFLKCSVITTTKA